MLWGLQDLNESLHEQLTTLERKFQWTAEFADTRSRFKQLIAHVAMSTGQRVVILVDEYDKPILDRIEDPAMAQLKGKNYAAKYLAEGQPIYLIGVEFSKEARNLVTFEVQSVAKVL